MIVFDGIYLLIASEMVEVSRSTSWFRSVWSVMSVSQVVLFMVLLRES